MRERRSRNRTVKQKNSGNGKLYIQIIICIIIISTFMVFKDTSFPNGKTPRDYANQILTTTVNLPEIIAKFKEQAVIPAGAEVLKP